MKLTIGHNEILAGICAYLEGRGVTGFDPHKVHASFSVGRKSQELTCELDDNPTLSDKEKAEDAADRTSTQASAKTADTAKAAGQASGTSAAKGGENAAAQAAPLSEKESPITKAADAVKPDPVDPQPSNTEVVPTTDTAAADAQPAGEENLFG